MCRVSGFQVLQWLQEHPECKVIPTIVLSSSDKPSDVSQAYQLGANAYLVKPNLIEHLHTKLRLAQQFWAECQTARSEVLSRFRSLIEDERHVLTYTAERLSMGT